jgi:hypothetical protein
MFEAPLQAPASNSKAPANPFTLAEEEARNRNVPKVNKPSFPARFMRGVVSLFLESFGAFITRKFWADALKVVLSDAVSAILSAIGGQLLQSAASKRSPQPRPQSNGYPHATNGGPSSGFSSSFAPSPSYQGNAGYQGNTGYQGNRQQQNEFTQPTPPNRPNTPGNWR